MIARVKKTIKKFDLVKRGERVVVAVSGGPDSVALLTLLYRMASDFNLDLMVAHFNHGLRGLDSDDDENLVQKMAERLGLKFISEKIKDKNVPAGVSPEDYYRRCRYEFLIRVAGQYQAQKIALGHNMQDQAETVLLHLIRGSGLSGLKGILPVRDNMFIRPFIETSRKEIIEYLQDAGFSFRQDSSNADDKYLRNKIRLLLLPFIKKEFNPNFEENLAQTAEILRAEDEFLQNATAAAMNNEGIKISAEEIAIDVGYIRHLPRALQMRIGKNILEGLSAAKNGISHAHVKALIDLFESGESGRRISLPFGREARREYGIVKIAGKNQPPQPIFEYPVAVPGLVLVKERNLTVKFNIKTKDDINLNSRNKLYLDFDNIKMPTILRSRKDGDWFVPLGMTGRQKIKSFFINRKIPKQDRNNIMLLVDAESVVCVENMQLAERVKISEKTSKVLEIEIV